MHSDCANRRGYTGKLPTPAFLPAFCERHVGKDRTALKCSFISVRCVMYDAYMAFEGEYSIGILKHMVLKLKAGCTLHYFLGENMGLSELYEN